MVIDVGFWMLLVWFVEGFSGVVLVYLYWFDYLILLLKLLLVWVVYVIELFYVWGNFGGFQDFVLKLGDVKVVIVVFWRVWMWWINFVMWGKFMGFDGELDWLCYEEVYCVCLIIGR